LLDQAAMIYIMTLRKDRAIHETKFKLWRHVVIA
jgi:hypothetical protein